MILPNCGSLFDIDCIDVITYLVVIIFESIKIPLCFMTRTSFEANDNTIQ